MDKRYQVFVSSTFIDLEKERHNVMQSLLELDCMPSGMELFPASNEEQWSLIKRVIDDCDYYILILGGRYGSINKTTGLSYTEMEYRYALEKEIPVISFVHKNPNEISLKNSEQTEDGKQKLEAFKELIQSKMVQYWSNSDDLSGKVTTSMVKLMKHFPRTGWVKASDIPNTEVINELVKLRNENERLLKLIDTDSVNHLANIKSFAQGDDVISLTFKHISQSMRTIKKEVTWNIIVEITSEILFQSTNISFYSLLDEIDKRLQKNLMPGIKDNYKMLLSNKNKIIIQLQALGIVQNSNNYFQLTNYGHNLACQLLAIKRE